MIGAIIGDIIGSRFEGMNSVPENFELLAEHSKFTDDTVHTIAKRNCRTQADRAKP